MEALLIQKERGEIMNEQQILQLIIVYNSIFVFFLFLTIIARKEIFFMLMKFFKKKGCFVFIANSNRNLSLHFRTPKEGTFRISNLLYVTNPEKVESYSEEYKKDVADHIRKDNERVKERIAFFESEIKRMDGEIERAENDIDKKNLQVMNQELKNKLEIVKKQLEKREQVYYYERRPSFFYIEGDPVPKDFYEWYTHLDSAMIDNVIARSLTKDPKVARDLESWMKRNQMLIYIIIGGLALALFLIFRNQTMLQQIASQIGVTFKL